jgi:uncharacterized HhH-GPD family protein
MQLAQDAAADAVLASEPFVLVVGMLLDQQVPMERAFGGAARLHERLRDEHGGLVPTAVAAMDPEQLAEICAAPPAVHRFPAAMARRIHALAVHVRDAYDGDVTSLWRSADTGDELAARLRSLPGFGPQKAQIFLALLGKQLGIQPEGWREAAGPYGATGSHLSVADVVDAASLAQVRAYKQEQKQAKARSKGSA